MLWRTNSLFLRSLPLGVSANSHMSSSRLVQFSFDYSQLVYFTIYLLIIDFRICQNVESKKTHKYGLTTPKIIIAICIWLLITPVKQFVFSSGFRCLPDPFLHHADSRRHPAVPDRAGNRSENEAGIVGGVEHNSPLAGWHWHSVLRRHLLRCPLLQRHHHVVLLLFI